MKEESFEEVQEALDPHRREEREGVRVELTGRVAQKGIDLEGNESAEQLDDLMTAIERFELAVQLRGGELMLNMPHSSPPENPGFVLPRRKKGEDADAFTGRVQAAAEAVEQGQR